MEMNPELLKKLLEKTGRLKNYVVLEKDDRGFYIRYAFCDGAPHDNRCLSWYDSYQEGAYTRNRWFENLSEEETQLRKDQILKKIMGKVGKIFELEDFTCDWENGRRAEERERESWKKYHPEEPFVLEDHVCKVGCPAKICKNRSAFGWTYSEPVKCACWKLGPEVKAESIIFHLSVLDIQEIIENTRED